MCRAVKCEKCKKTTWAGCGRHIESVMKDVPADKRCACERPQPETLVSAVTALFRRC